jgi:hypothetical protein
VGVAFGPGFASGNDEDALLATAYKILFVEEANEFSKEECLSFGGDLE